MHIGGLQIHQFDGDDGGRVFRLIGELDLSSAARLLEVLLRSREAVRVVVDTTALEFIDSSGLDALLSARQELGEDRFALIPGRFTERLLEVTNTRDLFGV